MKKTSAFQLASFALAAAVVAALWARIVWVLYAERGGLFRVVAADWGGYFAQAAALADGKLASIYDLQSLGAYRQFLALYSGDPTVPTYPVPVPYPALFAWLFSPLTYLPPPIGFALWTCLNVATAAWLAWRVAALFAKPIRPWVVLLVLGSFPVVRQFITGQTAIWIACIVMEMYLCLRAGRDFRAGLWLGCLLLKPQLAILIGPLLLWKRRWAAVMGAAISGLAIVVASIMVAGFSSLLTYPSAIAEQGGIRGFPTTAPEVMVNWRALILLVKPDIGDRLGLAVVALLGFLTVLCIIPAWRGHWNAREAAFPVQVSLLLVATLIVSYHSHADYVTLLAFPLAAVLVQENTRRLTRIGIVSLATVPTVTALIGSLMPATQFAGRDWFGVAIPFPPLYAGLLLLCYVGLCLDALRPPSVNRRDLATWLLTPMRPLRVPAQLLAAGIGSEKHKSANRVGSSEALTVEPTS